MLNFISIVLIFFLDSFPIDISKGVIILPYILYLGYRREKRELIIYIILAMILSVHMRYPILSFIFIGMNLIFYEIYFRYFNYNLGNILILSVIQFIAWQMYIANISDIKTIVILDIGIYFFINLLYMRRATR